MKRICVFCGSSSGFKKEYAESAAAVGRLLAASGIELVYGGGKVGLMGAAAKAALAHGGKVIGVIPRDLSDRGLGYEAVTCLEVVENMHERKARMAGLSDAFIALPGGYGTFEEIFEALTWMQLGLHTKPCAFLNSLGYYDKLLAFLRHTVAEGFIGEEFMSALICSDRPEILIEKIRTFKPVKVDKAAWALGLSAE